MVFKLTPGGTETVLYSFCSLSNCSDGAEPFAGLIADSAGNLYGTASAGGTSGNGVVFKLAPGGTETVLHAFAGVPDGAIPYAGLIADSAGNLYGTTFEGGASNDGVVFKLAPPTPPATSWNETVLYSFMGSGGGYPTAGLIADSAGNLYGTTKSLNGTSGTVFRLAPGGTETVLYSFCSLSNCSDGAAPAAGLIADSAGNLYGTTYSGGATGFYGTVFKLAPPIPPATSWTETVLYSFGLCSPGSPCSSAEHPLAGLIADSAGNLYGTTITRASGFGVAFELAGTGFVPDVPFAAFSPTAMIDFGTTPDTDAFILKSSFTLGSTSKGIDPLAQPVTFQIGTLALTIPPGSFTGTVTSSAFGPFTFTGTINGVSLHAAIAPTGTKRFSFQAGEQNASLTGTVNPVPVTLTIGNNNGTASVSATLATASATTH